VELSRHGIVTKRRLECVRGFENRVFPRSSWDGGRSGHGVRKRQRVLEGETHTHIAPPLKFIDVVSSCVVVLPWPGDLLNEHPVAY
jgi:hypothetical protein